MSSLHDITPLDILGPSYNIYRYTDQIYKIVHFKRPRPLCDRIKGSSRNRKGNNNKIAPAVSRARKTVLECALCNEWDWFATFTLDKSKHDRFDLSVFEKKFKQWIRDLRKSTGAAIAYLLVPELHEDGAWHMHGLLRDVPGLVSFRSLAAAGGRFPSKLIKGDFYDWPGYSSKFGFCSLGRIRDHVACSFYISKYITLDLGDSAIPVGGHLYYVVQGLNRSTLHGSVVGESDYLNNFCGQHYQFCDVGFTSSWQNYDWTFALDEICPSYEPLLSPPVESYELDPVCPEWYVMQEVVQQCIENF